MSVHSDDGLELRLGTLAAVAEARLKRWQREEFSRRLWRKDPTLWAAEPVPEIVDRLGWLELPVSMQSELEPLARFVAEARADGLRQAVVLGMGGSSLAPEVFAHTFQAAPGYLGVRVLDSTHPGAVRALTREIDLAHTLFLVSSKSGTTTEMLSFFYTFWQLLGSLVSEPGRHFAAITDPGTPLVRLAAERRFRAVFNAPPDVGGRYSALTPFGLVPAALLGVDVGKLLARGGAMAAACDASVAASANPGLRLGAALGELAAAGRDKVTLIASPSLAAFPDWLEQLIAESTGKSGRGIVPVVGEPLAEPSSYGSDRLFVTISLAGEAGHLDGPLGALERAGHPVARIVLGDRYDLGREMFRWEVAVAAASAVIGVHPFNQPDVQLAKELASRAMRQAETAGAPPADQRAVAAGDEVQLAAAVENWLAGVEPGTYLGIQAYLMPGPEVSALRQVQTQLRDRTRLAVTFGYGPRFLHSTGQLHKGGPARCRFLQLVDTPSEDLAVPETNYTYARLIRAQADGDRQALEQRGRRVLRVELGADGGRDLARLESAIAKASLQPAAGAE